MWKKDNLTENKKKTKLLILSGGIILFVVVGIILWFLLTDGKNTAKPATETEAEQGLANELIYSMDIFVVNLTDPGGKRYLKTKISLGYYGTELTDEIKQHLPQIRDLVLVLLSSKTVDAIQGTEGIINLRQELIQRINQALKKGKIKNLYFTEFVIQ